jgi:hypothetical protein
MLPGQAERRLAMRTDKLAATWDHFLRLSPGERRVFLDKLRYWHLQRRIEAVASRGGDFPYRGPSSLGKLSVSAADLMPREQEKPVGDGDCSIGEICDLHDLASGVIGGPFADLFSAFEVA